MVANLQLIQVWAQISEGLHKKLNVKMVKIAACLLSVFLAGTMIGLPSLAMWANDPFPMLVSRSLGSLFVASGMIGLAIMIGRRKGLYKIPVKLAVLLLCFYGSALAVASYMEGLPALVPYCLMTFALLLVIFW